MKNLQNLLVLGFMISFGSLAHAECYGVFSQGVWKNNCGTIPSPPARHAASTSDHMLNQNDKLYLCSLVQLSESQCADVQFSLGAAGINAKRDFTQYGFDVRLSYQGKHCDGAVWKTRQSDDTWVLSSPTSIFGFPYECQIP